MPDLAEARGAGRSGRAGGGGRAASGGRQASRFTAGIPQPRQARPAQARPTQATPRPSNLPSTLPTPGAITSSRDLQSLLRQGSAKATDIQAIQTSNFSREQASAKFDSAAASASTQSAISNFQSGPEPFSPAWYAEHPTAWQATHPHADTVAVASAAAVTSWLAYGAYPAGAYPTTSSTVVYEDNSTAVVYEESPAEPQPVYVSPTPTEIAPPAPAAEEWLTLGTYKITPTHNAAATQRLQLSVNRDGEIQGVYHDQLTGAIESLSGRLDSVTQKATWTLDSNPSVTFTASLDSLTSPTGNVTLAFPNGEQKLTLSREEAL